MTLSSGLEEGIVAEAASLLQRVEPFASLSPAARAELATVAQPRTTVDGELVIREGETGDAFYVVLDGRLEVVGRAADGSDLVVAEIKPGEVFGEQALLEEGTTRTASIRAKASCRLLSFRRAGLLAARAIDPVLFDRLAGIGKGQISNRRRRAREEILHVLGENAAYGTERFEPDSFVFREGDAGDTVYLILQGTARVLQTAGDCENLLRELTPGQFFGELAILNDSPRTASVQAATELEVASLGSTWFRTAIDTQPRLRSIMQSLQAMYLLPKRGMLTLQGGKVGAERVMTSVYHLEDGRHVVSARHIELQAFNTRISDTPEANRSARFFDRTRGILRELHVHDGRLVEIESEGVWDDLGRFVEYLLDGRTISGDELDSFAVAGSFEPAPGAASSRVRLVCRCSGVTAESIGAAIESGCSSVGAIADRTAATLVCGACVPAVRALLGEEQWVTATCIAVERLSPEICAVRLRPEEPPSTAHRAGQHIVLQATIAGRSVERAYTIASAPQEDSSYEIIVKRETRGLFSRWLYDEMREAAALNVSQPQGSFCVDPANGTDCIFFAGGIGITPALAMARTLAAAPADGIDGIHLTIIHSISTDAQAICREELQRISATSRSVRYSARVSERGGRLGTQGIADIVARHEQAQYFLCGSDAYVDAIRQRLIDSGVGPSRIFQELFSPSQSALGVSASSLNNGGQRV